MIVPNCHRSRCSSIGQLLPLTEAAFNITNCQNNEFLTRILILAVLFQPLYVRVSWFRDFPHKFRPQIFSDNKSLLCAIRHSQPTCISFCITPISNTFQFSFCLRRIESGQKCVMEMIMRGSQLYN